MDSERSLLVAVLLQAMREAKGTDPIKAHKARDWLAEEGKDLAEQMNIDPSAFSDWLASLPSLPAVQPRLW